MKYKKITLILGAIAAFLLFVGNKSTQAKYINHSTTPTELRGTWYEYYGNNKFSKTIIKKHSFITPGYKLNTNKKGIKKLIVKKINFKGLGGPTYDFNKAPDVMRSISGFWLTNKKIHGKPVMAQYKSMGYFRIYTKARVKHNYSFNYNKSNYDNLIGSKNKIKKYIGRKQKTFN